MFVNSPLFCCVFVKFERPVLLVAILNVTGAIKTGESTKLLFRE